MDPRAGLDDMEKRKISCLCPDPNPDSSAVQPIAPGRVILKLNFRM
jgi:hypothetical protein